MMYQSPNKQQAYGQRPRPMGRVAQPYNPNPTQTMSSPQQLAPPSGTSSPTPMQSQPPVQNKPPVNTTTAVPEQQRAPLTPSNTKPMNSGMRQNAYRRALGRVQ